MRVCLGILALAACAFSAGASASEILNGKLVIRAGQPPAIELANHNRVLLDGDETTRAVLADTRVDGLPVEAQGHYTAPGHFMIGPSHTRAMMVRQDGKVKMITYWCPVCSLRAYTPGPCVCCYRETDVDLHDPDTP